MDHILLITLVVGGTALLSWPLGTYMAWAMDPGPRAAGRWTGLFRRVGGRLGRAGLEAIPRDASRLQHRHVHRDLRDPRAPAMAAAQPRRQGRARPDAGVQHRRVVHDEHQPPALFGRGVAELPQPARRPDVAAVRLGGDGHRGARGTGPGDRGAGEPRQLPRRRAAGELPRAAAGWRSSWRSSWCSAACR